MACKRAYSSIVYSACPCAVPLTSVDPARASGHRAWWFKHVGSARRIQKIVVVVSLSHSHNDKRPLELLECVEVDGPAAALIPIHPRKLAFYDEAGGRTSIIMLAVRARRSDLPPDANGYIKLTGRES